MKLHLCPFIGAAMFLSFAACAAAPAPQKPAAQPEVSAQIKDPAEIPLSVFLIPPSTREGRNPFFAPSRNSPVIYTPTNRVDASGVVLNGITGPPKRTAMINNRTFELGEEAEVRVGNGKAMIKCVELKDDSAVILCNGQRRELRLRFGL